MELVNIELVHAQGQEFLFWKTTLAGVDHFLGDVQEVAN